NEEDSMLTDPEGALDFVNTTNVDSLAVAVGTAHGVYKKTPKLDFDRLDKMNEIIEIPLVLHGASGVDEKSIKKSIDKGVCKINIATELKIPFTKEIRDYLNANPKSTDLRKYLLPAREKIKEVIKEKIDMCGSANKA